MDIRTLFEELYKNQSSQVESIFFCYSLFFRVSFEYEKVALDQMLKGFVQKSLGYIF